jgi:hypothetical protein
MVFLNTHAQMVGPAPSEIFIFSKPLAEGKEANFVISGFAP